MYAGLLSKPSLTLRIGIGKAIGFVVGLTGFILLPYLMPDVSWTLRWGILLWYTTLGAVVGVFGVYTRHPVLDLPMPWWIRAPFIGAWMNFVLTFFAYQEFKTLFGVLGVAGPLGSPFWFAAEGAVVGLVIGWFATKYGGEGPETASH